MSLLKVGDSCPTFTVKDQDEKVVNSADWKGKTVIVYFYPKDDTPGCTIEAQEFRDYIGEFEKKGALVFGVSQDNCGSHQAFIKKYNLNFPLLADTDGALYKSFGVKGRTTFVIGPDGKVSHVFEKVTPKGHAQQVLAKL